MSGVFKLRAIVTTLVLLALGYTALWYTVGFRTQKAITATLSDWLDQGLSVNHSKITLSGFPYRLVFEIEDLNVRTRERGLAVGTEKLVLISHLWTPDHWIAQANNVSVSMGRGLIAFEEDFVQASYRVHTGDRLVVKIDSAGASDMKLRSPEFAPQLDAWSLLLGKDMGDSDDGGGLYEKRTLEFKLFAQRGSNSLEFSGGVSGPGIRDWSQAQLANWRDSGGLVELDALSWTNDGATITANGDLTLDEEYRPLGSAALAVSDWTVFRKSMRGLGISVGNLPAGDTALMLQNGSAILGNQQILSLPRVVER